MKQFLLVSFSLLTLSCTTNKHTINKLNPTKYANSIKSEDLKELLYTFAGDGFEGRLTGESGQKKAVDFIKNFYIQNNVKGGYSNGTYFQPVPAKFLNNSSYHKELKLKDSENVLAYIKGSVYPNETLVISAHLDHLGTQKGTVFNGADDDGSGTVAVLEIAQAFQKAVDEGYRPKRSILFLHVTGEEKGLLGSKYYTKNPVHPLKNTIANLNIDMVGRIDDIHINAPNYLYLIGSDKLSKELHKLSEKTNKKYTNIDLDYRYNDENDPNRFYYRSDHYNFAKNNIPVIFYFNGTHADYHRASDTPDKIEYNLLEKRTKLIFYTAWELVNRNQRIQLDTK